MRHDRLTQRIADEAGRLLARDEAPTLDAARRKAALRLGARDPAQLPSDAQVQAALHAYRELFGTATAESPAERSRVAAEVMRFMADFRPELAESPGQPTVHPDQPLRILLYSEDPDAPLHRLLDEGIRHRLRRDRLFRGDHSAASVDVLVVDQGRLPVELWTLSPRLRGTPLQDSPLGDPLPRIRLSALPG